MDFTTILGLIACSILIAATIFLGGSASTFVNIPSILVVVGGTFGATSIGFPMEQIKQKSLPY
jgi:chemotaxis protein MotA